jgi:type VI secretion system secreted protein VgrG
MGSYKQSDRLMQFSSPAGKDVLLIESLEGAEGISRLFEFQAELLAEPGTMIDPTTLVGQKATVAIALSDVQGSRFVNGLVASFEQTSGDVEFDVYRARIVPSMWQLTLSSNCRVFQDQTVMDIVKKVIGDYGLTLSDKTTASYPKLEYCTQYDETDFNFISRILEQHGVFYWFEHTDQDNQIIFGDGRNTYADCALSASVAYTLQASSGRAGSYSAQLTEFSSTASMVTGKHSTEDYDFRTFAVHSIPSKASTSEFGKNLYEEFLYPAGEEGYVNDSGTQLSSPDLGAIFLESRALAADAVSEVFRGVSNLCSMSCGYTFGVSMHPRTAWNRKYLLTEVAHQVTQVPPYRSEETGAARPGYSNRFTAVSSDIVFKPAAVTRKPRIYGPQTGKVVGPGGEEIYVDEFGRVKVVFFWDRTGMASSGSAADSIWIRVAQPWAGNAWGAYFWPRVGHEVVVQFLNGDPDCPVVTGSVYNGTNMPPYALPDNKTRSGVLTRSSQGGSAATANELRFEDKKGSEQIYLHAEKDMDLTVEGDERRTVGGKDSLVVTGDQLEQINGDSHLTLSGKLAESVGGDANLSVGGNQNEQVGGNFSLSVSGTHNHQVSGNYGLSGENITITGSTNVVIQAGGMGQLTLAGSGGFITIGPAGVSISGTMVLINSGGMAGMALPVETTSPATPTKPDVADDGSKGTKMNG